MKLLLFLLLAICVAGISARSRMSNEILTQENKLIKKQPNFLETIVEKLADANIIRPEDLRVYYGRQSRSDNPLGELAFDVFKELISSLLSQTLGTYLGFTPTERTGDSTATDPFGGAFGGLGGAFGGGSESSGGVFDVFGLVMEAVRKNTIQRRMGCPT